MTSNTMFPLKLNDTARHCFSSIVNDIYWLWHLHYNHFNFSTLSKICNKHMVRGISYINRQDQFCKSCIFRKLHQDLSSSGMVIRASIPLELVHSDLCGPMRVDSLGGNRFFSLSMMIIVGKCAYIFLNKSLKFLESLRTSNR